MTLTSEIALAPLSALYGTVTRARLMLYQRGALPVHKLNAPVISVGNITTGGTGKTPLVEWIARMVALTGRRVCVLTRGYGRAHPGERVIVSDGERILADAREGGDEPVMLAEMLLGVAAVISDADRVGAARWAEVALGSQVFILDDGFQHLRIARDLNVLTIDATAPWGGGHLLPRGHLREPLQGLARADIIVITRADQVHHPSSLKQQVERLSNGRPVLLAHARTAKMRSLCDRVDETVSSGTVSPSTSAAAFCAIGNPQSFFTHVRRDGYTLSYTRAFADHHVYRQEDVDAIEHEAATRGAQSLITTTKDAVKLRCLRFRLPCYVLEIEIVFDDERKLLDLVGEAIMKKGQPT
ncbi:MAG TPA: tetraacyldisaccharide 4'-kinase [Pyrinomonadaceae bacterium]|jgi:tetraacyldisaccharide 4'-kinase